MNNREILSRNIRNYRKEHNLSIEEFSKMCCVSARQLIAIENQNSNARLTTLDKISAAMGITTAQLLKYDM